jgi:hypothetical protein
MSDIMDAATITSDGALIPAQVVNLARRIRALVEKGDRAAEKAEQFYKAAGIHIKEIKQKQSEHWETIVREQCGVGRSRAYELMAIADGKTTLEKVRADTNDRQKVHRAKSESVMSRTPQPGSAREPAGAEVAADWIKELKGINRQISKIEGCVEKNLTKLEDIEIDVLVDKALKGAEAARSLSQTVKAQNPAEPAGAPPPETAAEPADPDEINKRVGCLANTIRRHIEGLPPGDIGRFFTTLRDCIEVIELSMRAEVA